MSTVLLEMEFFMRRTWKNKTTHQGVATHSLKPTDIENAARACMYVRARALYFFDCLFN